MRYYSLILLAVALFSSSCRMRKAKPAPEVPKMDTLSKADPLIEKRLYLSGKLGISVDDSADLTFLDSCAAWLGVPYKYGTCSRTDGTDCSGLAHYLYRSVYGHSIMRSSNDIYLQCQRIDSNELKQGDLVFFKIEQPKVSHVGIYLADRKFIHSSTQKGVIVSSLDEPYYRKYFYASGRL
jgi:murein DD-endopeptidase / murein LD-carboxypeptidase